eukprot:m.34569 g.34569  ORF g.34569 m.34569 type:complete len:234 (+) comp9933_c0_seq1:248-949(+)
MPTAATTNSTLTSQSSSYYKNGKMYNKKRNTEKTRLKYLLPVLVWIGFIAFSLAAVVYSLTQSTWLEGTETLDGQGPSSVRREVGLFVQCDYVAGEPDNCFQTGVVNNITIWRASAFFFAIGVFGSALVMLMMVSVLVRISLRSLVLPWAKFIMGVTSVAYIVAVTLFPLGFIYIDDECASTNEGGCGLACSVSGNEMEYFSLCAPYKVSTGTFAMFVGVLAFFLCSSCTRCV